MKPGRLQYSMSSMMIAIAILAAGFAYPESSRCLLDGAVLFCVLIGLLAFVHWFLTAPCLLLLDSVDRWLSSKIRPRPPARPKL
jgi:hypothetical protein